MPSGFSFELRPSLRDVQGRFATAEKFLHQGRRDEMRRLGRAWVELAQEEAPKRTGRFAEAISYRTFSDGETLGFRGVMAQPLGTWIVKGTRRHVILPRHKQALWWEGARHPVRKVNHPGTRPNRFTGRAYRRWLPGARAALRRLALRYSRTLASGTGTGTA